MKRTLPLLIIVFTIVLYSCEQKRNVFKIHPLSPFSDLVEIKGGDISSDMPSTIKTQYYIVSESTDYTDATRERLQNFIEMNLKNDIQRNKAIYFTFYKGGITFTASSVQTKNELIAKHSEDKLAEFEYVNGKQYNFDFYKDGSYYNIPVQR